jgi:hypothetical protein
LRPLRPLREKFFFPQKSPDAFELHRYQNITAQLPQVYDFAKRRDYLPRLEKIEKKKKKKKRSES